MSGKLIRGIAAGSVILLLGSPRILCAQPTAELSQDPWAGSEVFESKGCSKCHAINGLGGTAGPDLGRIEKGRTFNELAATLWNHVPLMGAGMADQGIDFPEMTAAEAADLVGFLFTLNYFDPPGDVNIGMHLFTHKKCFVCHRVGNYGGDAAPNLDFAGQYGSPILIAAAMWNHGAPMAELMEERGIVRPTFRGSELNDLIAYIESVALQPVEGRVYVLPGRAEAGRTVFLEKRCNRCHSVQGVGGRLAPDLAGRGRQWGLTEFAADMWNKALAMLEAMEELGMSAPKLGGGEMADLVAYLYYVDYFAELGDSELGERVLHRKGCLSCHALRGSGGTEASDLAWISDIASPAALAAALWNHSVNIATMPQAWQEEWPSFEAAEMADLTAFLEELEKSR
ncbi:MAG: c-type cytochrome [Gemmatimonadales bacterium]|jgi:cytochrome c2